jgi:hypothetical protein
VTQSSVDALSSSPAPITVSTIRAAATIATVPADFAPFDGTSWDRWVTKGHEADLAFRQKARIVATISAGLILFGMLWITLAG